MPYKIGSGHNVALMSLTDIDPQPRSPGVRATRRTYSASGLVYDQALYLVLEWTTIGSASDYQTLLAALGLDSLLSANVTIYARDDQFSWTRYNGRIVRPMPGDGVDWDIFPRNVRVMVKDLAVAA